MIVTLIPCYLQRYLAIYFDSKWGKSIVHTNLTETLNHHSCDTFTHGVKFDCPLEFGFASHFQTEIDGFLQVHLGKTSKSRICC